MAGIANPGLPGMDGMEGMEGMEGRLAQVGECTPENPHVKTKPRLS